MISSTSVNSPHQHGADSAAALATEIRELTARLDEVRNSRRWDSSFRQLTFVLMVVIIILFFYFVYDQSNRLTALGTTLREELVSESRKAQASAVPAEAVQRFTQKLDYIEFRQTAILDEARKAIERQSFIFTAVAAFFGLFTVFFGYRQLLTDSRGSEAREKQDQEMRNLVRSFQNNITTISSLITTLEQGFAYRKQIEDQLGEIRDRAKQLEGQQAQTDTAFEADVEQVNRDALSVVPLGIERLALSFEENRRRMEGFASQLDALERTRRTEGKLNPFSYYVRGLSKVTTYQYEAAIADFDIAARKAREDLSEPKLKTYALDHREHLNESLNNLLVACSYFQGISHKNLGQYVASAKKFRDALERNRQHSDALSYLPQVLFFDNTVPFQTVEAEFQRIAEEVEARLRTTGQGEEREKLRRAGNLLLINYGDIYHRKAISPEFRSAYRRHEDPAKAVQLYWRAHDLLSNDLATFSLAQALEHVGPSDWRDTNAQDLFATTFTALKSKVAADYDKLYSVTLYYMLAICAAKLRERRADAEVFLSQARHSLKEVPTYVTCFSPISRIRLTRPQILEEMEQFEKLSK